MGARIWCDTPRRSGFPRLHATKFYGDSMSAPTGRPPGRPPRHRDRHAYVPQVEGPLRQELQRRADQMGVSLSAYADGILAVAHGFTNPWVVDVSAHLPVPVGDLRSYVDHGFKQQHGARRRPSRKLWVRADRDLAVEIDARCSGHDVSYAEYVVAILRAAVGHPLDQADWPEQGALEFEGEVAS